MDISLSDILWIGGGLLVLTAASLLFTHWGEVAQAATRIMPSKPRTVAVSAPDIEAVYIPVSHTDMDDDIDEMPRIGRRLSDTEVVILLAAQRRIDGKQRFSANQIYALVGGDRNTVMRQIKELREGPNPAEYRPITPEQQAQREALGLAR